MSKTGFITQYPIAHRGLHDGNVKIYENSMAAMKAAIEAGYAIELDVQVSADGIAMVFHDASLERLTNQSGLVIERDAEELQTIKLGSTKDTIDTLEDVLNEINGAVPVIIEMKGNGDVMDARSLARSVADELAHYHGNAAVMSFEHALLNAFSKTGSKHPLGLTAEGSDDASVKKHLDAFGFGISFVSFKVDELPNEYVAQLRQKHELPVITWTVRTPEQAALTNQYADQMTFEGFLP